MRIVVIGGSGFIGTRLVKLLLSNNSNVLILDKVKSETYPDLCRVVDIRNPEQLTDTLERGDVIINLAAEHKDNVSPRSLYDDVNVTGAANVCDAARKNHVKAIIFTSSVAVYGFTDAGTYESGSFNPFNDYGRTKMEAESVYIKWAEENSNHSLVIVRPTVVFGEQNRGNVYNLLRQIASGRFIMIGNGKNSKSMAYVGNVVAFLEYAIDIDRGKHIYNYIDKPDFDMNSLVSIVRKTLNRKKSSGIRIPYFLGYAGGIFLDIMSKITGKKFSISAIRVKKFYSTTMFSSSIADVTDFKAPYELETALISTIKYEFVEDHNDPVFFSE